MDQQTSDVELKCRPSSSKTVALLAEHCRQGTPYQD